MDKKKVMGHNPLGINHLANAKFEFIPFTESGSVLKENTQETLRKKKKVVSYYLEEELINKIKTKANTNEESYSTFVGKALTKAIKE